MPAESVIERLRRLEAEATERPNGGFVWVETCDLSLLLAVAETALLLWTRKVRAVLRHRQGATAVTNESKPSERAMRIARKIVSIAVNKSPSTSDRDTERFFAPWIDSAIADAVRKEAEECAKAMAEKSAEYAALIDKGQGVWPGPNYVQNDIWVNWVARRSAFEQAERAIRARHTTDSKEQPR